MIVIVEDRSAVADAYRASFEREGVSIFGFLLHDFEDWVADASPEDVEAIEAVLIGSYNRPQPLIDGIKRRCSAAIIALKEEKSLTTTLELFAGGVDDVVAKPCHAREILARIEAITRRGRTDIAGARSAEDIRIFRDGRDPIVGGEELRLPRRELRILEFLVNNRTRRVSKAQIFSSVYGLFDNDIDDNVIESHISKLRRRLRERLAYDPIDSRRHLGYRLVSPSVAAG